MCYSDLREREMKTFSYCFAVILFILSFGYHVGSSHPLSRPERRSLEIIIGGGGSTYPPPSPSPEYQDCPPPPPPPEPVCRPPSPPRPCRPPPASAFESPRLALVYPVIQRFRRTIKCDPHNITGTWEGTDICHRYKGFSCDTVPKYNMKALAGVSFNNFNFDGDNLCLEGFLDELPDIAFFHANSNNFTGALPARIGDLPYLYELDLSNNKYTGEFPSRVLQATRLTFVDLRYNQFSGCVPPQLFKLDLDVIFINNNKFIPQQLPDTIGSTPAVYISLANDHFTGQIPRTIGQASKTLVEILLLNNQLSGCLPYEIGFLNRATLFDVGQNRLTGPIPHSFGCLRRIQYLNLAENEFYGPVPEMVCTLPNLVNVSLSYNYFTQVGPECWKLIHRKVLDVRMNCILDLPYQRSAADCKAFFSKPRYCPDEKSLHIIPCKGTYDLPKEDESSDHPPSFTATPPQTYDALVPRGV